MREDTQDKSAYKPLSSTPPLPRKPVKEDFTYSQIFYKKRLLNKYFAEGEDIAEGKLTRKKLLLYYINSLDIPCKKCPYEFCTDYFESSEIPINQNNFNKALALKQKWQPGCNKNNHTSWMSRILFWRR